MTDQVDDIDLTPAPAPKDANAAKEDRSTKSFWVGIGSAALAAALLYAKRPKGKRRT